MRREAMTVAKRRQIPLGPSWLALAVRAGLSVERLREMFDADEASSANEGRH